MKIPQRQKLPTELVTEMDYLGLAAAAAAAVQSVVDVVIFDCQNSNLFAADGLSPDQVLLQLSVEWKLCFKCVKVVQLVLFCPKISLEEAEVVYGWGL